MSKKKLVSTVALVLVSVIGLTGCAQEVSSNEQQPGNQAIESPQENTEEVAEATEEQEVTEESQSNEEPVSNESAKGKKVYISASKLKIRGDSNAQSEVLGSLVKGKEVEVVDEVVTDETTWYKIRIKSTESNNEGWISSEYTVKDLNDLLTSPTIFDDQEKNAYFTSPTLFEDNTVIAYYGHPNSEIMGIVGRHPKEELISLLKKTSEKYDAQNGDLGVVPAIYLVYGTVQPGGEINTINFDLMMSYIEEAYKNGVLVYLDNQMGKYAPVDAMKELLPFLKYPNVHLALDPEWRTNKPMKEVGHITGAEINEVQKTMQEYMIFNGIQGKRQFVFHQFLETMIRDIQEASSDYDPVLLVHNTSGWGPPEGKVATHTTNSVATNIPYKGFKLWYFYSNKAGVHYDNPLMTPEQVLNLNPKPGLIIYQ